MRDRFYHFFLFFTFLFFSSTPPFLCSKTKQESASVVALVGDDVITSIDINIYKRQLEQPITEKEALKAIIIRKLF